MGHGEYRRSQFTRLGDFGVSEEWRTVETLSVTLAYADHYNGAVSSVTVFEPGTGRTRSYAMRSKDKALRIIDRHLEREGYKKCVEFRKLDGSIEWETK